MATKDKATLISDLGTTFPDNNTEQITPAVLRGQQQDVIESYNNLLNEGAIGTSTYGTLTNVQILALGSPLENETADSSDDHVRYTYISSAWYSPAGGLLV